MSFTSEFTTAKDVLLEASSIVLKYYNNNPKSHLKENNSIVTEADEQTESLIRSKLTNAFPAYGFIGEETNEEVRDISWIVDPIDGTLSYARGIPDFSMVLALVAEGKVQFSLIYLPLTKTLYHAKLEGGAFRDQTPIRVSTLTDLEHGIISIDRKVIFLDYTREYGEAITRKYKVRMGDHSGTGSVYLAQGSIDVLIKFNQSIWDAAPESLLMTEAGAILTDEFARPLTFEFSKTSKVNYIATTPSLHEKYADLLYYKTIKS